jgi:hypothetical protein
MIQRAAPVVGGNASSGAELDHRHTSDLLDELVSQAPDGPVNLDWLLGHLDRRSLGLILLMLGLLAVIPGLASVATLILLFPAVEMMLGRSGPSFPHSFPSATSTSGASNVSRPGSGRRSLR